MIPIISVVGKSDSGKTTLIEKLLPVLTQRGYRVATVKHDIHGFEVDREGKDSWRHKKAGAQTVIISSPQKVALIQDVERDLSLDELRERFIQDVDLILSEGYKKDDQPKVEIFRKEKHRKLLCTQEDRLVAVVSNEPFNVGVPCFDLNDVKGLADFIENRFLKLKERKGISVYVNGRAIPLTPFVGSFLRNAIQGMIRTLKTCAKARRIRIEIEDEP